MPQNPIDFNPKVSRLSPLFNYLGKQKENEKFFRSIEIGATFLLISFFLFFAIRPTAIAISTLLGDINSKQLMTKQLKTKINNVIMAQDAFSQVQAQYQIVNSSLPDKPEFYLAANQIAASLNNVGLAPESIQFALSDKTAKGLPADVKSFDVNIPVNTDFIHSQNVIYQLSKNRRIISIPSFTISNVADAINPASKSTKLSISTAFYYWDQSNVQK